MAQGTTKGVPIDIDGTLANNSDLLVASQKATKTYVDNGLSLKQNTIGYTPVNKAGDTMIGNLILNANPTLSLGAATKDYVDTLINGIDWKQSANAGTVSSLPTYAVTGSGQILTGTTNGAISSAVTDGVTLVAGNRVLVKNETSTLAPNNGIYVVTQAGSVSLPFILTRASDSNTPALLAEATLSVSGGSTLSNTQWHCNPAAVPIVIGTTNITFAQIGSGTYTAGSGLTLTGNIFSITTNGVTDAMIQSATNWNTAYTNIITSLTTTGSSGAATLTSNTLNIPNYTLAGLGGVSSNIYTADGTLTSARTLTSGGFNLTFTGSNTASSAIARGILMNHTLVAAANNDVLVGLDIAPTFTNGEFTGVVNNGIRLNYNSTTSNPHIRLGVDASNSSVISSSGIIALYAQNAEVFYASTVQTIIKGRATTSQLNFNLGTTEFGRFHVTTGNFALQNGGTFTDGGQRLQVVGTSSFTGTTATDGGQLGAELTTTGSGTNWAGTGFATGYTHTTGSVVSLTTSLAAVNGNYYQITYTITGRTAGTVTIDYGGVSTTNISGSNNIGIKATATTSLSITPTTDFDGTIVLSIKQVTAGAATMVLRNSGGTITNELRSAATNNNLFLGVNSGQYTTTGANNVAYGYQAMQFNLSGIANIAIGYLALQLSVNNNNQTAVGSQALQNSIGSLNTALGASAGIALTTGANNTLIGTTAGLNITTGSGNAIVGQATRMGTTSANNAVLGDSSGYGVTGNNNTFIGKDAGRYYSASNTAATAYTNSIMIGYRTKQLADNQTNQIVIGYDETGLGSNTTIIGNSSTVTTAIRGNLLLGTTTDGGQRLQVTGTSILNGFATISGSTTAASLIARGALVSSTLVAAANNDVLVGLDISPTFTNGAFTGVSNYGIRTSGQLRLSSYTTTTSYSGTAVGYLAFDSSGNILTTANPTASMAIGGSITSATAGSVLFAGTSGVLAQNNSNFFWDNTNNRLGVNTNTPLFDLETLGTIAIRQTTNVVARLSIINQTASAANAKTQIEMTTNSGQLFVGKNSPTAVTSGMLTASDSYINNQNTGDIVLTNGNSTGKIRFGAGNSTTAQATLTAAGRLLIGTTSELTNILEVNGTGRFQDNLLVSKDQNATTTFTVSNTTSGTASQSQLILTSDATAGSGNLSKKSNTFTTSGIINLADLVLQNSTNGDIAVLNSFASGAIKFAAGGSSTAHVTIGTTGLTTFATGVDYKRLNPTTITVASTATLTPDISAGDTFTITAQAAALSVANPTGTPVNGQKMIIRIKDVTAARAITWSGTQYRASTDLALPTTTILGKTMYLGFIYNSTDTKWDLLAYLNNF